MTEIPKSMTPEETAKLREAWIRDGFVPTVASVFAKYPTLRSATMLVAQYWSDEAEDAVHYALVYSVLDTPDLDAARAAEHDADPVNHPPGFEAWDLPYVEVCGTTTTSPSRCSPRSAPKAPTRRCRGSRPTRPTRSFAATGTPFASRSSAR